MLRIRTRSEIFIVNGRMEMCGAVLLAMIEEINGIC
jgi:hypothetical protein